MLITFFPERLIGALSAGRNRPPAKALVEATPEARMRNMRRQVEETGLRAQLQTGSFLTGELYVAFEYFPNAPKVKLDFSKDPLELPVVPGGLANLEAKLSSILTKIDNMPLNAIGSEVKNALATLNQTLKDADTLINRVDAQWVPEGTKTLEDARGRLPPPIARSAMPTRTCLPRTRPAPQDLRDTLQEVDPCSARGACLVDYLERHPEILIRGKTEEKR